MIRHRNAARPRPRAAAADPPSLLQFVVLSMLLHLLLIVLFGNPTGGTRRNEGWLGPLDVTLAPQAPEAAPEFRLAPGLEPLLPPLQRSSGATAAAAESPRHAGEAPAEPPASVDTLPRLSPGAPEEVDKPLAPSQLAPTPLEPLAPMARPHELAPPVELPPRAPPAVPALPIEKAVPPRSEPQLAPPVALPPRAIPVAPEAPLERTLPPPPEPALVPAPELRPRAPPAIPVAPLERLVSPPAEREVVPPVELPPRAAPIAPDQLLERLPAPKIEREVAPAELPSPRTEPPLPAVAPSTQPPASVPPRTAGPPPGTPDANEDLFKPRRDQGAPPSDTRRIDLDAARKKAAREIVDEGTGSRGVFTVPSPPTVEPKAKAAALDKAIKPDCRTAYANLGLLAVPVLVANTIAADGRCRW